MRSDDPPEADEGLQDDPYDEPDEDPGFWGGYPMAGWWPPALYWGGEAEDDDDYAREEYVGEESTGADSWWDEGLITLLIVVGAVLFLFPEPATSAVGVLLLATGVALWIADWVL